MTQPKLQVTAVSACESLFHATMVRFDNLIYILNAAGHYAFINGEKEQSRDAMKLAIEWSISRAKFERLQSKMSSLPLPPMHLSIDITFPKTTAAPDELLKEVEYAFRFVEETPYAPPAVVMPDDVHALPKTGFLQAPPITMELLFPESEDLSQVIEPHSVNESVPRQDSAPDALSDSSEATDATADKTHPINQADESTSSVESVDSNTTGKIGPTTLPSVLTESEVENEPEVSAEPEIAVDSSIDAHEQTLPKLPNSSILDIGLLQDCFKNSTGTHKFLMMLALLHFSLANESEDSDQERAIEDKDQLVLVSFQKVAQEMLVHAVYPLVYGRVRFPDSIRGNLFKLSLPGQYPGQQEVRRIIRAQLPQPDAAIMTYVPFRLLRPFFPGSQGKNEKLLHENIAKDSRKLFNSIKPFYQIDEEQMHIELHPEWKKYFLENYECVYLWTLEKLAGFLKDGNPDIADLIQKIAPPDEPWRL